LIYMDSKCNWWYYYFFFFFFQAEDGIRDLTVTGVQRVLFRSRATRRSAQRGRTRARPSGARSGRGGDRQEHAGRSVHRWTPRPRSEERRVGKECRTGWGPER